jgi:hypothetical protein
MIFGEGSSAGSKRKEGGERKLENCCKVFYVLVIEILLHILVESAETESR